MRTRSQTILRLILALLLLYCFLVSIGLIGHGFKLFGKGFADALLKTTADPLIALFIGILATALVQSSSTTTSIIVGLVGSGGMSVAAAVPMIMGANVGTTITNMIVSVGHIGRPHEFRRAFSAAIVHDFFNIIAVIILFPIEQFTGVLTWIAHASEEVFQGLGGITFASPVKMVTNWAVELLAALCQDQPWIVLILSLVILFFSLAMMVKLLRQLVLGPIEGLFSRTVFKTAPRALLLGLIVTVGVQSSSVSTSVIVPLVAAGLLTVEQIFPYTLGANVGTTVTALLASLAIANPAAITVAMVHLWFNIMGICVIWPIRWLPIGMAHKLAEMTLRNRLLPIIYILCVFFGVPLLVYWLR